MIQSPDIQLQVVLRALSDVVAPALGGAEKHVIEQFHLSLATLQFLKTRMPDQRRFQRMELRAYMELATGVADIADDAPTSDLRARVALAQEVLDDPEKDIADFEAANRGLREAITALSNAVTGTPSQKAVNALILERHGAIADQARVWCLPFGFELEPEKLAAPAW